MYDENIPNRYICDLYFGEKRRSCIVDTACSTTLVPLKFAQRHGKRLGHTATVVVAGNIYKSTLYLFEDIFFGSLKITKMVAFAANYKGNIEDRILLGLNVINNFEILLSRHRKSIDFNFKPWSPVENKKHPCAMFFKDTGSHPVYPTELLAEIKVLEPSSVFSVKSL